MDIFGGDIFRGTFLSDELRVASDELQVTSNELPFLAQENTE